MTITHISGTKEWFVSPNGSGADDSAQIQSCLDAMTTGPDAGPGVRLSLSAGVFYVKTMLVAKNFRGEIIGAGTPPLATETRDCLTRIVAGTSSGVAMDYVPAGALALQTTLAGFPNLFSFYEESTSFTGQQITISNIQMEAVALLAADAVGSPPLAWGTNWRNRGIMAAIYVGGKAQAHFPILYASGEKAVVGRVNLTVSNCQFYGHNTSVPYSDNFNSRESTLVYGVWVDDFPGNTQQSAYGGPVTTYGVMQVPSGIPYLYYVGPDIPRTGNVSITQCRFQDGAGLFVKHQWSRPATQPAANYIFDGPNAFARSVVTLDDNVMLSTGESVGGGFLPLISGGCVGHLEMNRNQLVTGSESGYVGNTGGIGTTVNRTNGSGGNFPFESSSQPSAAVIIADNVIQTNALGKNCISANGNAVIDASGLPAFQQLDVLRNVCRGDGFAGNQITLQNGGPGGLAADNVLGQDQPTAIQLPGAVQGAVVRHNTYRGVLK